jgi:hypothetical protein
VSTSGDVFFAESAKKADRPLFREPFKEISSRHVREKTDKNGKNRDFPL